MKALPRLSVIVIYGPAGSGKTSLADAIQKTLANTAHIGVDHIKRFISEFREVSSHQEVSKKVIKAMTSEYLKNTISVIVEQGMSRGEIEQFKEIAETHNAAFFVYRLDIDRHIADTRAHERHAALGKPAISKETLEELYEAHQTNNFPNTATFDSGVLNVENITASVLESVGAC